MKSTIISLFFSLFFFTTALSNGVGVVNATTGSYLKLFKSHVDVSVENQVAMVKTTQTFKNVFSNTVNFKYAFPMPESASAVSLKWYINGTWNTAVVSSVSPDTSLPGGGGIHWNLKQYLGSVPLYFGIDDPLQTDSLLVVELTYVQLLPYEFGNVDFFYPNDYSLIQSQVLDEQKLDFHLNSARTIDSLSLIGLVPNSITNNGNSAYIGYQLLESAAVNDYKISYTLSLSELGLFGFSTYQPDTLVPDEYGRGFFSFIAEPDPSSNTNVIEKVFTLIIDRSGSMSGNKIVQARNCAAFIVNNLNEGDKFNLVDFASDVTSFRNSHVPFNNDNKTAALNYISNIYATGATNISGAFDTAVPQFASSSDSIANIIIFFTDGAATAGITNTPDLVAHVDNLVSASEKDIMIFTFGIGDYVNEQLLTLLASHNHGLAEFLGSDDFEDRISKFYLKIQNPVLLNTQISFQPDIITQVFPSPLPSLYKGSQMIVSGRYNEGLNVNITLSGEAFGQPVTYNYTLSLADSQSANYQFLPKIWAKQKIENLFVQYYSLDPSSPEAIAIKNQIIQISVSYGVITSFTSFTGPPTFVEEEEIESSIKNIAPEGFKIIGNYPNPFNPSTTIRFSVGNDINEVVKIKIFNSLGELIRILEVKVNGSGFYEVIWDGKNMNGVTVPSDVYVCILDFGNTVLAHKMVLLK